MATKKEEVELTVDAHNKIVAKEIAEHQDAIKKLQLTYKSESEKKQATLHECNMMSRGTPKDQ